MELGAFVILGYSGLDMENIVKDALNMGPLREALRKSIDIAILKKEDTGLVMFQVRMFGNEFVCPK